MRGVGSSNLPVPTNSLSAGQKHHHPWAEAYARVNGLQAVLQPDALDVGRYLVRYSPSLRKKREGWGIRVCPSTPRGRARATRHLVLNLAIGGLTLGAGR